MRRILNVCTRYLFFEVFVSVEDELGGLSFRICDGIIDSHYDASTKNVSIF